MDVEAKVKEIIMDKLGVEESQITPTASFINDLGADSLRRLNQLVHDMPGSRLVGIAHAEVDDVFAARTRGRLQLINDVKDIRRQAFDTGEFFNQGDNRLSGVNPRLLE